MCIEGFIIRLDLGGSIRCSDSRLLKYIESWRGLMCLEGPEWAGDMFSEY